MIACAGQSETSQGKNREKRPLPRRVLYIVYVHADATSFPSRHLDGSGQGTAQVKDQPAQPAFRRCSAAHHQPGTRRHFHRQLITVIALFVVALVALALVACPLFFVTREVWLSIRGHLFLCIPCTSKNSCARRPLQSHLAG